MNISTTLAYVGPGPGLTMVWAFLALMGTILLAIVSILLWPIRMLIRKMRGETTADQIALNKPAEGAGK